MADLTAVYRMYGPAGELLYIGMTSHLRRFDDHAVKRWFPLVARIDLEWHPTEASARLAERRAIQAERPRYNIADTPRQKQTRATAPRSAPAASAVATGHPEVLLDVLAAIGGKPGLQWGELAEALSTRDPARWIGISPVVLSAQCRALGVPSVDVKRFGRAAKGCRRADVAALVPTGGRVSATAS